MTKLILNKFAIAGALMLSTALSLPALAHQSGSTCNAGGGNKMGMGQMPMMSNMMAGGMMGDHMGVMGDHTGMMGNMMGGHRGMMHKYKGLELSDGQKQQMADIQHALRKKHWEIMGQVIDQHAALQKAYAGDRPDPALVGAVYGKVFDLKRQMIEAAIAAKNNTKDVLTKEQIAKMKKMKHQHGGMMQGMMGGQGGMMQGQEQSGQAN